MDQPHIGYTSWRDPPANTLAAIKLAGVQAPNEASLGVATDGGLPTLPAFDSLNQQRSYIDIFNKGREPFEFTTAASAPWIALSQSKGRVVDETRVWVTIDWAKAPAGVNPGSIKITGAGHDETINLTARKPSDITRATLTGFAEGAGYVAIDAGHFTSKTDAGQAAFRPVEQYGMRSDAPVDVQGLNAGPHLDYRISHFDARREVTGRLTLGPALIFAPDRARSASRSRWIARRLKSSQSSRKVTTPPTAIVIGSNPFATMPGTSPASTRSPAPAITPSKSGWSTPA